MSVARKRRWLRDNGLTLVLALLFAASFAGHIFARLAAER
jgi:hypothetical protein